MRRFTLGTFAISAATALLLGCDSGRSLDPLSASDEAAEARGRRIPFATLTKLPSLGGNSEAHAVDATGTVVVGQSGDRAGYMYAVKWTFQGGSWVITTLPYQGLAAYFARGVSDQGDVVGYFGSSPQRAVRWSASTPSALAPTDLDCVSDAGQSMANGISADGSVIVGQGGTGAAIWPAGGCRLTLPPLGTGGSRAFTVDGDGTIVGGSAAASTSDASVPVRWTETSGVWSIQVLDSRAGGARGANAIGDLAGYVVEPCAQAIGCTHAVVWDAASGAPSELGTLESDYNVANDINSVGEVVGYNASFNGSSSAFIWSALLGVRLLPDRASDATANAVSEVRVDGTRVAVGMTGARAAVWVIRDP